MITSILGILLLSAIVATIIHAVNGKCPLWVPVLLLEIAVVLMAFGSNATIK